MKVLSYWAARTGIFLVVVGVLWLLGLLDVVTMIMAILIAWAIGYVALPGMRAAAAAQMEGWVSRSEKGLRDLDAEEDAEAEKQDAPQAAGSSDEADTELDEADAESDEAGDDDAPGSAEGTKPGDAPAR